MIMKQEFFIHFAKVKKFMKSRIHEIVVNIQKKSFVVCHLLGHTANGCLCRGLDRRAHGKAGVFAVGRIGAHGKGSTLCRGPDRVAHGKRGNPHLAVFGHPF